MIVRRRDIDKRIAYYAAGAVAVGGFVHGVFPTLLMFSTWALGGLLIPTLMYKLPPNGLGMIPVPVLLITLVLGVFCIPMLALTFATRLFPVSPVGLRKLADLPEHATLLEAEYCRALAELIEQKALVGSSGRQAVGALNTLLHHGRLIEENLKKMQPASSRSALIAPDAEEARLKALLETETDEAQRATVEQLLQLNQSRRGNHTTIEQAAETLRLRHEVILQTFIGLRETMIRTRLAEQEATGADFAQVAKDVYSPAAQTVQEMAAQLERQALILEKASNDLLAVRAG